MGLLNLESMVRTVVAIGREVDDAQNIWDVGVKDKKKESQPSFLALGRSRRLLLRNDLRDRAVATKAKARVDHLQVVDLSGLTANQGRGHASIAISLDT